MDNQKNNKLKALRHSLSHIMMQALVYLYKAIPGVGPDIDNGFYHDFDAKHQVTEDDLVKIEKEMRKIIKENLPIKKKVMTMDEGIKFLKKKGYKYTAELAQDLKREGEDKISFYQQSDFINMCKGPHLKSTSAINTDAFKLTKIAGAYWKGDEKNKMIQRIYGVAFATKKELDEYLKMMEEAEKRDHKKLGKELDLFTFHPEAPGSAFWHAKGMIIWNILESLGKSIRKKYGSVEIQTPILAKTILWKKSGHWEHYKDSMFHFKVGGEGYTIKPMDCPFNIMLYQEKQRSYKDLPIRFSEIGRVFRNEKSGELNGLLRVQHVTQDDAHIFCMESQIEQEIITLLKMVKEYYAIFKIEPNFYFANRPDDYMGEVSTWNKAERALVNALNKERIKYGLKDKDGAFYGPKIDINIDDALGRSWQLATIQLDFQLPQRFNLEYIDKNGNKKTPVMIHAAIFGSLERFIGIMTEHYAGAFPVWLSPVQVKIISVGAGHIEYCHKLTEEFKENEIRVEVDDANETVGNKIRKATKEKVPYMLVIGDKEMSSDKLAVRDRGNDKVRQVGEKKFIEEIVEKMRNKK